MTYKLKIEDMECGGYVYFDEKVKTKKELLKFLKEKLETLCDINDDDYVSYKITIEGLHGTL
jgi:hypothetical protein